VPKKAKSMSAQGNNQECGRRTRTSTIFRPASLLHSGALARLLHRIVTVTLRQWRHHECGFAGAPLDPVLKLSDRRVTLGVRRGDRLDIFLSGLGKTVRRAWNRAHHLRSRLVLALPLIRHLPPTVPKRCRLWARFGSDSYSALCPLSAWKRSSLRAQTTSASGH
jgi:hypothetical protein